jgi:enolase
VSATSIAAVRARRVWDSRGRPTVEAEVQLEGGAWDARSRRPARRAARARRSTCATAARASAATTCCRRASTCARHRRARLAVATHGPGGRRRGDHRARRHAEQGKLGGNATVAVSMAVAHAAAAAQRVPLWKHLAGDGR